MSRTPKGGRRRLDSSAPPDYDVPTREPRLGSATGRLVMVVVFLAWVAGTAAAGTSVVAVDEAPSWIQRPAAALLMVVFARVSVPQLSIPPPAASAKGHSPPGHWRPMCCSPRPLR